MPSQVIVINPGDNVAIALKDLQAGEEILLPEKGTLLIRGAVPYSHKVALTDIPSGAPVIKYGEVIGEARGVIGKGEWVHTHNLDIEEKVRQS